MGEVKCAYCVNANPKWPMFSDEYSACDWLRKTSSFTVLAKDSLRLSIKIGLKSTGFGFAGKLATCPTAIRDIFRPANFSGDGAACTRYITGAFKDSKVSAAETLAKIINSSIIWVLGVLSRCLISSTCPLLFRIIWRSGESISKTPRLARLFLSAS